MSLAIAGTVFAVIFLSELPDKTALASLILRGRHEKEGEDDEHVELHGGEPSFWRVAWMSFGIILVAEFGDLTQIATATLAARYHDPLSVGVGAVLGLWVVAGVAIVGGRSLLKVI